jgi:predicted glycoside hydrolase/deacetylase ChbG (UPF0249 family)
MATRLIINADDFGLTPGINRAIAELHQAQVLTSTTLMATGPAFEDAVAVAHANPTLGIGCHIVLTDGVPVSSPESIPTLIGPDRKTFRPSLIDFVQSLLRGRIREDEIEREASAQIQKLQLAGIEVTHLDTPKHPHLFPAINRLLLRLAEQHGVHAIRHPFEQSWSLALNHGNRIRRLQVKLLRSLKTQFERRPQIRDAHVLTTDGTIGISATGNLYRQTLHEILHSMPAEGTFELVCHPGYNDSDLDRITTRLRTHRDIERNALLTEVPALALHPNAPQLINFGDLGAIGSLRRTSPFITNS